MVKRPSLADKMREEQQQEAKLAASPETPQAPRASQLKPKPLPTHERSAGFYAATRVGKKKVTASLDPAAHKQLKHLSLDRDMTTEALLVEAINDLFKKHGKAPIA